ncbi:unnamed protein product, partial [marine sediment metagenome]
YEKLLKDKKEDHIYALLGQAVLKKKFGLTARSLPEALSVAITGENRTGDASKLSETLEDIARSWTASPSRIKRVLIGMGIAGLVLVVLLKLGFLDPIAAQYYALKTEYLIQIFGSIKVPAIDLITGGVFMAIGESIGQFVNRRHSYKQMIAAIVLGIIEGFALGINFQLVDKVFPSREGFINQLLRRIFNWGLTIFVAPVYFFI